MFDANTRSELSFAMESYMGALDTLQEIANSHVPDVMLDDTTHALIKSCHTKLVDTLDHLFELTQDIENFGLTHDTEKAISLAHDMEIAIDQTEVLTAALRRSISTGLMTAGSLAAYLEDLEEAFTTIFTPHLMNGARYA